MEVGMPNSGRRRDIRCQHVIATQSLREREREKTFPVKGGLADDVSVRRLSSDDVTVSIQGVRYARLSPCQRLVVSSYGN